MSLEEILQKLEDMQYVVLNPRDGKLVVQRKWYDVKKIPYPGIRDLDVLAASYRKIWPAGVKSGNLYVRSGIHSIISKMRLFLKKFPEYTNEDILAAAHRYVDESSRDNYQYMKTAEYFIFKEGGSQLETYCEVVKNNEEDYTATSNLRIG